MTWRPIRTAPKDDRPILVYGFFEGEVGSKAKEPGVYLVEASGRPDYMPIIGTCYYSAWVTDATYWQPAPTKPVMRRIPRQKAEGQAAT